MKKIGCILLGTILIGGFYFYKTNLRSLAPEIKENLVQDCVTVQKPQKLEFKLLKEGNKDKGVKYVDTVFYLINYSSRDSLWKIIYHDGLVRDTTLERKGFERMGNRGSNWIMLRIENNANYKYIYCYEYYPGHCGVWAKLLQVKNDKIIGSNSYPEVFTGFAPVDETDIFDEVVLGDDCVDSIEENSKEIIE